jgi:SAM-dependent methyltransferase
MRILDIGCGTGRHVCEVFRWRSIFVVGADLHRRDLVETRKRLALHRAWGEHGGGRWALSVADLMRLPFRSGSFDRIICSEVLEHIHDQEQALAELARVLRVGGRMAVSVPRWGPEWICWQLWAGYGNSEGGHIRIYRRKELSRRLEAGGFTMLGHHYAHALHSPYWWLNCLQRRTGRCSSIGHLYRRFLEWSILQGPGWLRFAEKLLDPVLGKSLVVYVQMNHRRRQVSPDA